MGIRIAAIFLALLLSVPAFSKDFSGTFFDGDHAFRKFSMGAMIGLGPSLLNGAEDIYGEKQTVAVSLNFRMAFPISKRLAVVTDLGFDYLSQGIGSKYSYLHRTVRDTIKVSSIEVTASLNISFAEHFFIRLGPSVRFPDFDETVSVDEVVVFNGDPEYARSVWLDAVAALGAKSGSAEFALRGSYEFLGFYKETPKYRNANIHEVRLRFCFSYWFGQRSN
jgi:hypothetical protein